MHRQSSAVEKGPGHAYLAPEVRWSGFPTKEADIFAFGVLMWEVMSGCLAAEQR
jgi:hypothetical protein